MNQFIKIRRLFRTYTFLHIFLKINILSIFIYFFLIIINNYRFPNENYHASIVRDREELRLAHLRTLMYDWYHRGKIPFVYHTPQSSLSNLNNKHGLVISIMASNRVQYQIDDYQPDYLIQSLSTIIKLIFNDISKYGYRFKYINIMICLNGTEINELSSVNEIIQLIGQHSIYPLHIIDQLFTYMNLSVNCQFIKDMSTCMLKSVDLIKQQQQQQFNQNDYILIIQEDMIATNNLFDLLWELMQQSINTNQKFDMIQLYSYENVLKFPFYHEFDRQLFELTLNCLLLITIIAFFIDLRATVIRRRTLSLSQYRLYMVYLMLNLFFTLFTLIWLYGVNNLLIRLSSLFIFNDNSVFPLKGQSYYAKTDMIMANLYSAVQVKQIGYYLKSAPCEQFLWDLKQDESKCAQLITSYLVSNIKRIFSVYKNVFKHCGLYSNEERRMLNPADVE
ncbi:unnamed protein product [Schistosoma turkestanicum]|nr:unnamed protein product [Schistosoma turkestanicum]